MLNELFYIYEVFPTWLLLPYIQCRTLEVKHSDEEFQIIFVRCLCNQVDDLVS